MPTNNSKPWGEFDLIGAIRRHRGNAGAVLVGPGDDCAVLRLSGGGLGALSTDTVVEGAHFDLRTASLDAVGYKAYASALSDIAAMGMPAACGVAAVALPRRMTFAEARRLERGLRRAATRFDAPLAGGDIASHDGPLVVTVTVFGQTSGRLKPLLRSGARPGHRILVTGTLGGSLLGRHLKPQPRLAAGVYLNESFKIGAMIDISDGLAGDLGHILEESHVGATINAGRVPVSAAARRMAKTTGRAPLWHALHDGEDYELLLTAPPREADKILKRPPPGVRISAIGDIVEGAGLTLRHRDGHAEPLNPRAFEHRLGRKDAP